MNQHSSTKKKNYTPLIGAALAAASLFNFSLPVLAVGTDAGLELKNTATATYENEDGSTTFEIISNEVTVTVGKIAGITNIEHGFVDNDTSATNTTVLPGDSVSFDFKVTNTGNDVSDIFVPTGSDIVTSSNLSVDLVEISKDDGENWAARSTFTNGVVDNIAEDDFILVRVTATVADDASDGDTLSVLLGDTDANDNGTNTQNQVDDDGSADPQNLDIRTITSADANTDVDGDPVNGQREASALNTTTVGSNPLALPRIQKTNAGVNNNGTGDELEDDVITYNLNLEVADSADAQVSGYSNFPYNAADLEGRDYTSSIGTATDGIDKTNLILISDAIPENTRLNANITGVGNWTPVYTSTLVTTAADEATWSFDAPANQAARNAITRVGWVYDARATDDGGNGPIAAGTSVSTAEGGFTFEVVTSDLKDTKNTNTTIYNIAQIFGSTDDGNDATTGGQITFDESGDQNPNNFNDDGTSGSDETVDDGDENFGYAASQSAITDAGIDTNNDNSATSSDGGEFNEVDVTLDAVVSDLLNGPDKNADATGEIFDASPADDNHDFQNLGVATPTVAANNTQSPTYNPDSVTFNNTVENSTTAQITDVILEPVGPTELGLGGSAISDGTSNFTSDGTTDSDDALVVRISYDGDTADYAYNSTTDSFTLVDSTILNGGGAPQPIEVASINGNSSINYTVEVDLPVDTQLSTNDDGSGGNIGGYPIPIVAYKDDDNDDNDGEDGLTVDDTYNVTVNQVYAGYLKLVKKARVLRRDDLEDPTSTNYSEVAGMGFDDADTAKFPIPGDIIEYQVTFTNISDDQGAGSDNVTLRADDIFITEDGTTGDNNWAVDGNDDDLMDTLHVISHAAISGVDASVSTNITYDGIATESQEVEAYEAFIAEVDPGEEGTFTFQRKVTEEYDLDTLNP